MGIYTVNEHALAEWRRGRREALEEAIQRLTEKLKEDFPESPLVNEVQRLRAALELAMPIVEHQSPTRAEMIRQALSTTTEPTGAERVREPVRWFAEQMEENLRENDHKGGWENENIYWLFSRLKEESTELLRAVDLVRDLHDDPKKIISEAADVANFAMMIADNARRINAPEKEDTNG